MNLPAHQRMLTAVAARMVGASNADDIVQETFLRALAHPPPDPTAPMAPWLVTVARNLAIDFLRQRGRFVAHDDDHHDAAEIVERGDLATLLAGLGALTEGEVVVLLLRDALDLDVDEVARALDTSAGSVRVLHHRARKKALAGDALERSLVSLDRFLTWLLARSVAGLPVVHAERQDPGFAPGVVGAHLALLGAMIDVASKAGRKDVEGRARLSRATALVLHAPRDAVHDLRLAIALGADLTLAQARLGPVLYNLGQADAALATVNDALARGDRPELAGVLHTIAATVELDRGAHAAAAAHVAALRASADVGHVALFVAGVSAAIALAQERYADARAELEGAMPEVRAWGNTPNEVAMTSNLAFACLGAGDLGAARAHAAAALALARSIGDRRREAKILGNLATVAQLEGRLDEAAAGFADVAARCTELGLGPDADLARCHAAVVEHQRGRPDRAAAALAPIVARTAELPGRALLPRLQLLAARAELGEATDEAFDALAADLADHRGLARALALYRLRGDPVAVHAALGAPGGVTPPERIARSILARWAAGPR